MIFTIPGILNATSFLPSFPPCFSASVYPCRSNKFFPVVKMNHPVVDFTASIVPLIWCLVLVQMPSESFLPSPRPQLWSPHLFPEVCVSVTFAFHSLLPPWFWWGFIFMCLSLYSPFPSFFIRFFFFWTKFSGVCAHACWYKSSLCHEQTHRSLGQELAWQPQTAAFLLRPMLPLLCLFERYRDRRTGCLPSHLAS